MRAKGFVSLLHLLCVVAAWAITTSVAHGQPVPSREPDSTHIFPAGGRRGTTVAVRVGTQCFPPYSRWRMEGAGITVAALPGQEARPHYEPPARREPAEVPISYSREWESTVDISPDAPLGPRLWCITSARGGSGRRPFVVGDLPEFIETESNSLPQCAEPISLPVTINGQIAGERDLDFYSFVAESGQNIRCELAAARLGSQLDAVLEVRDEQGRRLEVDQQHIGSDPVVSFRAPHAGRYTLMVANVGCYGGPEYVYRATLTAKSQTDEVQPTSESPANDTPDAATIVSVPFALDGCFERPGDEDWFQFVVAKDAAVSITCEPKDAGMPTLPCLELFDHAHQPVAHAIGADAAGRRAHVEWRSPSEGRVSLRVRDLQRLNCGGPEFGYHLSMRENEPDFELSLAADYANILPGKNGLTLEVVVLRVGGFDAPIELRAEGLPPGVTAGKAEVSAKEARGKLVLTAGEDARPGEAFIKVIGRAMIEGEFVDRVATCLHQGRGADGVGLGSTNLSDLHLTVQHKPVFRLFCNEAYQYGHRGSVHPYLMEIERLDGFDGPVTLQLGDRQNRDVDGIEMFETVIPAGATQAYMPVYLPEDMHVNVQSQSQLYVQGYTVFADRWGGTQSLLVVSEKRNIIRTLPPVVKLEVLDKTLVARPGATLECRVRLERTPSFQGPMEIGLPHLNPGFSAEPITIGAGATNAVVRLHVASDAPARDTLLKLRACGHLRPDTPLVSEARVNVVCQ
ncbi:MAG TPA: PPC domain-containing protein [Pirellulales bacterium]|nr:PPC domain-containing protein [Pirellulales bacterium]